MKENKILRVKMKRICGKDYFYPENEMSESVLSLCKSSSGKRKALIQSDIDTLMSLGFEFEILKPKVIYEETNK